MRHRIWLPFATFGVLLLWALSALFDFSHAYILAGGSDNPLMVLTGQLPRWEPTPLGVGVASIGADIVKAIAGFMLVDAICNRALRWYTRVGAIVLSLLLATPTFMWSFRSAIGMAALAFGDTIAQRHTDKLIATSIATAMEATAARLKWLSGQTTCSDKGCISEQQEAAALRQELHSYRDELRSLKVVGAADPGGAVIASLTGWSSPAVTNLTIALFMLMLEIPSTIGLPALRLLTRLREDEPRPEPADPRTTHDRVVTTRPRPATTENVQNKAVENPPNDDKELANTENDLIRPNELADVDGMNFKSPSDEYHGVGVFPFGNQEAPSMRWSRSRRKSGASTPPARTPQREADRPRRGPPRGGKPPRNGPQGESDAPPRVRQGETARIERASKSLAALDASWSKTAETCPADDRTRGSAKEIAVEFSRAICARPEMSGLNINCQWIKQHYPVFCRSLGLICPPPYKDFAKELARLLPRKRRNRRPKNGKRSTSTWYCIPHPTPVKGKRKRAALGAWTPPCRRQ
jgi:hypothetical protein